MKSTSVLMVAAALAGCSEEPVPQDNSSNGIEIPEPSGPPVPNQHRTVSDEPQPENKAAE